MIMAGGNKLFPIDPEAHYHLVTACKHWPGVFVSLFKFTHIQLSGDELRAVIGIGELLAGIALVCSSILPSSLLAIAMLLLSIIMLGAVYLHSALGMPIVMPLTTFIIVAIRFLWFSIDSCGSDSGEKPMVKID